MRYYVIIISILCSIFAKAHAQDIELKDKRTYFSSTFLMSNDNLRTEICTTPVHYRDKHEKFQRIVPGFVPSDTEYDFEVSKGLYKVFVKSDLPADYPVVFENRKGANFKMKLAAVAYLDSESKDYHVIQNIQPSVPQTVGNKLIFPDVFNGVNLQYVYRAVRFKEEIIMSEQARSLLPGPAQYGITPENAYLVFVTKVDLEGAPMAYANRQKIRQVDFEGFDQINFRGIKGELQFFLPVDVAYVPVPGDSTAENRSLPMKRRLVHKNDGHFLLSGVKYSDLNTLPAGDIVFDPQIELNLQPADSAGVENSILWKSNNPSYANYNWGIADYIRVMRSGTFTEWHRQRILISFDVSGLSSSTIIDSAQLKLYCKYYDFQTSHTTDSVTVHKVLTAWEEGGQNGGYDESCWNKRTSADTWGTPGMAADTDYESTIYDMQILTADSLNKWVTWNVSDIVTGWVTNGAANNGMMLKLFDDTDNNKYTQFQFYSSESDFSTSYAPKLTIYHQGADLATTYYIRDAAGNVIATYRK